MIFSHRVIQSYDAEAMRELRLESLLYYGGIFEAFHAQLAAKPMDYWRQECTETPNKCWFGSFANDDLIGLQGTSLWDEVPYPVALWRGNYEKEKFRKQGLMCPVYEDRLQWARKRGCHHAVGYTLHGKERPVEILLKLGATHMFDRNMSFADGPTAHWHWWSIPLITPISQTSQRPKKMPISAAYHLAAAA